MTAARLLREWVPMASQTTYRMGGAARFFAEVENVDSLLVVSRQLTASGQADLPVLVLGRGSNLVISDQGFPGLVLKLGRGFSWIRWEGDEIHSGGATSLPVLARKAVTAGKGGLEFLVGIPGSVGGAVAMNAGGHGRDIAACLIGAQVVDLRASEVSDWTPDRLQLGYRSSALAAQQVVVAARFRCYPTSLAEGEKLLRQITVWRRTHQPGGTLNAGSVFKNPPGDSAGRIIDALGLKGWRVGGVRVSSKHANFFEAEPGASAQALYDLVRQVQAKVASATGIVLEPELRFVGPFIQEAS